MSKSIEFWTNFTAMDPRDAANQARQFEQDGWDGAVMVDSQCMFTDVWTYLALCAQATDRIQLGTGVTNMVTRHPSVTAAAAATLQLISGGRASLGVGRGDSSLAYVGASPQRVNEFEHFLEVTQTYLRGDAVDMADASAMLVGAKVGFDNLAIGSAPEGSRVKWLQQYDMAKVPMEVYATGPKVIAAAARHADNVMMMMTAAPARVAWGVGIVRDAAAEAGRDGIGIGCAMMVVPHDDLQTARDLARPQVASQARFSVMNKRVMGPATPSQTATLLNIADAYDMNRHGSVEGAASAHADAADDDFVDQFAVVGSVDNCVERLIEISELGVDRMSLWLPYARGEVSARSYDLLMTEVLPRVRAA
ncbi:Phthiodiolone/phenolphthiodiolone dimycocerosates ketoreductase [Microbacterium trichothecenolyticum]|uniref:Phthiodiolone/phenolphthiodiolone dimycocerosates ketoreductase n=2 Tax=Microbacterium trichothecenolyticum TaxID=69370 RepID=A0A0M2H732_MICTR|nr:LLM class flavin-dependent oxidoreductase [Microbacterium trichothecenolyticum]KJL42334.1 Phthiodiolone/phenolphthiodiolone dimycocerosates ketoreductase [Microbacterium trichothecenolyticum]